MTIIGVGPGLLSGPRHFYHWRGVVEVLWMPAVAVAGFPTRAELSSSIDLASVLHGVAGFHVEQSRFTVADVQTGVFIERPGATLKFAASALNFYDDLTDPAVRITLAAGTSGSIGLLPYGDVAGRRMEVWPVETLFPMDDDWSSNANPATFTVPVVVTSMPELNAVVPA